MIASDALECAQVKIQTPRHDTGKRHWALAFRTWIALDCDHGTAAVYLESAIAFHRWIRRERKTLSHR